jgi:Fe-S-cluster-containing dehydrogenase component
MRRFALQIAEELCWGCKTCEAACKQENNPPKNVKRIRIAEDGPRLERGEWYYVFRAERCRHCAEPPCVPACPETAIAKRDDGIVVLNEEECSGCRSCLEACPYAAIDFDEGKNTACKCNLCHHRLEVGLLPACADNVCPAHCIRLAEGVLET